MPARGEFDLPRQDVEVNWTPEAEAALAAARESLEAGDDFEAYRLLGMAAAIEEDERSRGVLLGFAIITVCGFVMGALFVSLIWILT